MKVKLQMVIESDDGRVREVEEIACLKRGTLSPEELGLTLAEAKQILQQAQHSMVDFQTPNIRGNARIVRTAESSGRRKGSTKSWCGLCSAR